MAETARQKRLRELGISSQTTSPPIVTSRDKRKEDLGLVKPAAITTNLTDRDKRKMELGLVPDTRKQDEAKKLADSYKTYADTHNQFESPDIMHSPTIQKITSIPNKEPIWNGIADNPITNTVKKGLSAVGEGIENVKEATGLSNIEGAVRGFSTADLPTHKPDGTYLGEYKALGQNAVEGVSNLAKSTVQGFLHPKEASKKFEETVDKGLANTNPVTRFAGKMIAMSATDPTSYIPLPVDKVVKLFKSAPASVSTAFDRFISRNSPMKDLAPEVQPTLALPPATPETMAAYAKRNGNVLPANEKPIYGQGDHPTLELPESNTPRIISDIKQQANDLIKPPKPRRDLISYVETHLEVPRAEVIKMTGNDLYELGQEIRKNTNVDNLYKQIASDQGHNWDELISGKSVSSNVEVPLNKIQFDKTKANQPLIGARNQEVAAAAEPVTQPQVVRLADMRKQTTTAAEPEIVNPVKQKPNEKVVAERGHVQTLKESEKTPDEFKINLDSSYTKLRNVDAVTQANKRISKNIDDAEAYVMGNSKHSPEKVATAGRLIDEFNKSGNYEKAVSIAEKVSKELTEAGQTVQAASIFNRLTPEGALIRAQRKVTKINEDASKLSKPLEITPRNAQDIKEAAEAIQVANVSKERANDVIDIMDKLKAKQAITDAEKKVVQDFVKDAQQFVRTKERPIRERQAPAEMGERRVKDKVISFLDAQEAAAKSRMAARRGRMNSLPFDEYIDMSIIVAAKLAKGTVKTADITAELIKDFGEGVKPHLASIFTKAHEMVSQNAKRISKEVVSQAERITENYIKKNDAHIKPEDVDFVRGLAKQVSALSGDARKVASQDLQAVLSSFEKAGLGKKISAVQYIAMLLNPLTQVKNIIGNELLYRLNRLSRVMQTPIDIGISAVTGKDRTITFKSGPATWENFFAPTRDYLSGIFQGAKAGWRGVNIEGLTTSYDISGQAFRSKLNPLTYLEKTLGATMKGFDYAAFNRATQQRLRETAHLDAINKGIKGKAEQIAHIDKYMSNLDDNIAEIAHEFGKKITLQDNSMLANKIQGLRGGLNQLTTGSRDFGVGSLVLPFAKTPANLLMRAIEYSPAGFGKAIMQASKIMLRKNTDLTRADVIQSVTDALLGTGLTVAGVWLASKGVLRGESSSDKDVRGLESLAGLTQYQMNASALQRMLSAMVSGNMKDIDAAAKIQDGDTLYQYEWAQPSSIPLALGANIHKERNDAKQEALKGQKPDSLLKQGIDESTGALNTLFNTSVLQGIQQAFDFMPGESNKIKAFLTNIVKSAPSMFVPTMVGRVNQFQDNAVRETYSPEFMESVFNPSKAKIPGQADKLPQRVNTLGQPQTKENSIADLFFNPAAKTRYKPSPEAKLVMDLLSETGDERVAPRSVPKYITGTDPVTKKDKKVMLTGEQFTQYQTIVGQETIRLLGKLNGNLTTEQKVKKVIDILSDAGEKGRKEMRKTLNLK